MVSVPLPASTHTLMPVFSLFISPPDTPTIVGKPSSLATTAEWERRLQRRRGERKDKEREKGKEGGRKGEREVKREREGARVKEL